MDGDLQKYALPVFGFIFFFTNHLLVRLCLGSIRKLSDADVYVITCRVVSAIHAVISTVLGLIIAYSCRNNIMNDVHWLTNTYVYFGVTYFPYDTWAMYAYNVRQYEHIYSKKKNTIEKIKTFMLHNKLMTIHHVIFPSILLPVVLFLRNNRGDFFFGVFYMIEIVVPFLSARGILIQLKMKDTQLYRITSILMIIMFFLSRIMVFPYLYSAYSKFANISLCKVPFVIPAICNISCLLILLLQVYWFCLMIQGLYRALIKGRCQFLFKEIGKIS